MRLLIFSVLAALALSACGGSTSASSPPATSGIVDTLSVAASPASYNHATTNSIALTVTSVTGPLTPASFKWYVASPYPAVSGSFSGTSATATVPPIAACLTTSTNAAESLNFYVWGYDAAGNQVAFGAASVPCF